MPTMKYTFFSPLWGSFYDRNLYKHVRKEEKGLRYLYCLMLCAISAVTLSVMTYVTAVPKLESARVQSMISQLPPLTVKDGVLTTTSKEPVSIQDPETRETWIVVDTGDKFKEPAQVQSRILLNSTSLKLQSDDSVRSIPYKQFAANAVVEPEKIPGQLKYILLCFVALMTIALFVLDAVAAMFKACVIGGVIKLCGSRYSFSAILRLLFVSSTPAVLVGTLLSGIGLPNLPVQIISSIIAIVYMVVAFYLTRDTINAADSEKAVV